METEQAKQLINVFKAGGKYSLYGIDSMMAMCHKTEIIVRAIDPEKGRVIFSKPRGRKQFILPLESRSYQSAPIKPYEGAIFEGWDQPIKCDTEQHSGVMRGNACYNFIGTSQAICEWIEAGQLNPSFDKGAVVAIDPNSIGLCGDSPETVVFPEEVRPGNHAVIDRLIEETEYRLETA